MIHIVLRNDKVFICLFKKFIFVVPLRCSAISCQKLVQVDDVKLHTFYEKHMATEVAAGALGEEWKGYVGLHQGWE